MEEPSILSFISVEISEYENIGSLGTAFTILLESMIIFSLFLHPTKPIELIDIRKKTMYLILFDKLASLFIDITTKIYYYKTSKHIFKIKFFIIQY